MTARTPFMPLFLGDLLASTSFWEGEERALYLLLLAYQWSAGPLPADPARIARTVQYDPARFAALWTTVGPKFERVEGVGLLNPRLEQHRRKAEEVGAKRAVIGRAGAKARWQKAGLANPVATESDDKPIAIATELPMANGWQKNAIQSNPIQSNLDSYSDHALSAQKPFHVEHAESIDAPTFTDFKEAYPKFAGRQDWITAEHHWHVRLEEGASTRELVAAVVRYRAFCEGGGVSATKYVMTPAKFLSAPDRPWTQPWTAPEAVMAAQTGRESEYDRIKRLTHQRASEAASTIIPGEEEP